MTVNLQVGVDWNRDGFICWNTAQADALNEIVTLTGITDALSIDELNRAAVGSSSLSDGTELTAHGTKIITVATTAAGTDGVDLLHDGVSTFDLAVSGGTTYTFTGLIRGDSSWQAAEQITVSLYDQADSLITSVDIDTGDNAETWVRFEIEFTQSTETSAYLRAAKKSVAFARDFDITGLMLFTDETAPTYFNTGHALDYFDNVTAYTESIGWTWGVEPYEEVAGEQRAIFTLDNAYPARRFSNEYSGSPLFGQIPRNNKMMLADIQSGELNNAFYTGFIDIWDPDESMKGPQNVYVETTNKVVALDQYKIVAPLYENKTTGFLISAILQLYDSTIDTSQIATGKSTIVYFGDNNAGAINNQVAPQIGVWEYIRQIATTERGKVYLDGYGRVVFVDRYWLVNNFSIVATLADDWENGDFLPAGSSLVNQVIVKCYPRTQQSQTTLWDLGESITIPAGGTKKINSKYSDSNNVESGAKSVVTPSGADYSISGGSPTLNFTAGGQLAETEIDNTAGTSDAILSTLNIKGNPLTSFNPIEVLSTDQDSIDLYGPQTVIYDLKLLDDPEDAYNIGQFELTRFSSPTGQYNSIPIENKLGSSDSEMLFSFAFGDRISVSETQTGHSDEYYIVGAEHFCANNYHYCMLKLEIANETAFWVLGTSQLGIETTLAF